MRKLKDAIRYQQIRDAGFTDGEISYFGLMSKPEEEICSFLSIHFFLTQLLHTLNGEEKEILDDKLATHHFLNEIGIDTPQLIGLWHPSEGVTPDGCQMTTAKQFSAELRKWPPDTDRLDVFFKPRFGGQGCDVFGVSFAETASGEIVALVGNKPQQLETFLDNLPETPFSINGDADHGWLVQKKVMQHPQTALLNPCSLNTIRLNTYATRPSAIGNTNQDVVFDYAKFRVGRAGSDTDNGSSGGLLIKIDPETGCLKRGRYLNKFGGDFAEVHPDSGINFAGYQLPFWRASIAMCKKAARAFPEVRSIGWDVAITESGPLIIEGNPSWHAHTPQLQNEGYFTAARRALFEASGDPTPAINLPPERSLPGQSRQSWMFYQLCEKLGL